MTGSGMSPDRVDGPEQFLRFIVNRRSAVGEFDDRRIAAETLAAIVRCGLSAPSSKNASPWKLHVVSNADTLGEIADAVEHAPDADMYAPSDPSTGHLREWSSTVAESADFLRHAGAAIFVENRGAFSNGRVALEQTKAARMADALVGYTFEVLGIGAAVQNMLLAAGALGLHGRYMGDVVVAEDFITHRLAIEVDLVGVLIFGYSDVCLPPRRHRADDPRFAVWHDMSPPAES